MKSKIPVSQQGFTIVELMIALSVLSLILIMATTVMIQIGKLYTKGVNAANLQNVTRNLTDDISSTLQFSGHEPQQCTGQLPVQTPTTCHGITPIGDINPDHQNPRSLIYHGNTNVSRPVYAYCIDNIRYSYVLDQEQGSDSVANTRTGTSANTVTPHVLWRDTMTDNSSCYPLDISQATVKSDANTTEGFGADSKGFEMMGDHMRLTRFKVTRSSGANTIPVYDIDIWTAFGDSDLATSAADGSNTCRGGAGTEFCSIASLKTTVSRRLDGVQ